MKKKSKGKESKLIDAYNSLFPALCVQGKIMGASDSMIRDAIHDIFLELLEKKSIVDNIQNFKAYISVSLRRKLSKELKKQFTQLDESKLNPQKSYENFLISNEIDSQVRKRLELGISSLTPSQRKILMLRFYEGLSYEEIAQDQNSAIRTVYNQFHSAIKSLREKKIF